MNGRVAMENLCSSLFSGSRFLQATNLIQGPVKRKILDLREVKQEKSLHNMFSLHNRGERDQNARMI